MKRSSAPISSRRAAPRRAPLAALAALALFAAAAPARAASDSATLAAKSIAQVYAVQNRVFAFAEGGASYSALDLFGAQPVVTTRDWPWLGGAAGGAPWANSLLLRATYAISDSQRVARMTSLRYQGTFRPNPSGGGDSVVFIDRARSDSAAGLAGGAALTALAVRVAATDTTAALGFGRLGVAYARLAPENANRLFVEADSLLAFLAFPANADTALALATCRWNAACRVDTLANPPALDSVITLAIDSSRADSVWLLVATPKGLRRGPWRGGAGARFPYVTLPDTGAIAVRSVFTSPSRSLAWAFTGSRFYFSGDHGATWRVPPDVPGAQWSPRNLTGFSVAQPPRAAFRADTTFISFNFTDGVGIAAFRRDTVLAGNGLGLSEVLIDTADGLNLTVKEGALAALAVAQGTVSSQAVLVAGTTLKGVFYRRLDLSDPEFLNINSLKSLKGKLAEVITYPTLISTSTRCGEEFSRFGYRLGKDGRVTITVYNYAMEKVKTVVRNARRNTVAGRSEDIAEDRWDGCDDSGRLVSVGTYYVMVQSDQGEKAFGKVIVTRGRR